jgi:hypothetical protein
MKALCSVKPRAEISWLVGVMALEQASPLLPLLLLSSLY